jgi:hypothetical protein
MKYCTFTLSHCLIVYFFCFDDDLLSSEPLVQISEENMSPEARKRHKEFSDMLVCVVVVVVVVVYFTSSTTKERVCVCSCFRVSVLGKFTSVYEYVFLM